MQPPVKDQKHAGQEPRQQSPQNNQQSLTPGYSSVPSPPLLQRLHELPASQRAAEMQAIQRSAGNRAAQKIVSGARTEPPLREPQGEAPPQAAPKAPVQQSQSAPVIQRTVVDDNNPSKVVLDGFNRRSESVQALTAYIFTVRYHANPFGMMPSFNDLYDAVDSTYDLLIKEIVLSEHPYSLAETAKMINMVAHHKWLEAAEETVTDRQRLPRHEELSSGKYDSLNLKHYNLFDKDTIWRWTSKPSTEQVYTAKRKKPEEGGDEITYAEIVKVVAAHSGGNDKSNPYVKTLSFGRNPSSLMGVAASAGGDKHVLNIIDKTEYLYGIDINSLDEKGITAHAATARMISLFESEYVLVNTPGYPSISLDELATYKFKNPFKGKAIELMGVSKKEMGGVEEEMGSVKPDTVEAQEFDAKKAELILKRALTTKQSATQLQGAVQDKEAMDWDVATSAMNKYAMGPTTMGPSKPPLNVGPSSMGPGSLSNRNKMRTGPLGISKSVPSKTPSNNPQAPVRPVKSAMSPAKSINQEAPKSVTQQPPPKSEDGL